MSDPRFQTKDEHWWSMDDRQAVIDVVQELGAKTILEFGPGWSTRALIEGGATKIDTFEDDPIWAATHQSRVAREFPNIVTIYEYLWTEPLVLTMINGKRYDLALIDGPLGTGRRPTVLEFCLPRCHAVLIPTEEIKSSHGGLMPAIRKIAKAAEWRVSVKKTGPFSGAFALLMPKDEST